MKIEIAVFNPESALIAAKAGAHRIELCAAVAGGGLTPSLGAIELLYSAINIPINVMIRPREGDFCYSHFEIDTMLRDIYHAKKTGINGVVIGLLKPDGSIDIDNVKSLVVASHPMEVTFHRAFDMSINLMESLESVVECGCTRILTSGGKATAEEGFDIITELIKKAGNRISIMPGSGINSKNAMKFSAIGASEIHFSAKSMISGSMIYKKSEPSFGQAINIPDYDRQIPDANEIKNVLNLCR